MVEVSRVEVVFKNALKIMEVPAPAPIRSLICVSFNHQFAITAESEHIMYTLPVDHTVKMQVAYTDAKGNPASIDGEVSWDSSDANLAMVNVDPVDSTICRVTPVGSIGQIQVTASCDADLGDGVRELLTICDIEIVGGEAVAGSIQPKGEPEPVGHPDRELPGDQPRVDNTLPLTPQPKA